MSKEASCWCGRPLSGRLCVGLIERFHAKVGPTDENGCQPWRGTILSSGYGQISHGKAQRWLAHRLAWEIENGPILEGMTIDHVKALGCTGTRCVSVQHLEVVTMQENLRRSNAWSAVNSRKTACPNGHAYDRIRTRSDGRKFRQCSTCYNAGQRERRSVRKDVA